MIVPKSWRPIVEEFTDSYTRTVANIRATADPKRADQYRKLTRVANDREHLVIIFRALLAGETIVFETAQTDKHRPIVALEPLDWHSDIGTECGGHCGGPPECVAIFGINYKCGLCEGCAEAIILSQPTIDRRQLAGVR